MPIEYTYVCVECAAKSPPSAINTTPMGWISINCAPGSQDYLDTWDCVLAYATKQKAVLPNPPT